ncbi:hypothetical protein IWW48_002084 [Coemansia sp. RSA 1200]|nr:hypothetical protein IWW48_002084 [Coemansia sp. RSA 1200]
MTPRQSFNLPPQPTVPQRQEQQGQAQQYPQYPQYQPQQYQPQQYRSQYQPQQPMMTVQQPMMVPMQQYVPYQQPAAQPMMSMVPMQKSMGPMQQQRAPYQQPAVCQQQMPGGASGTVALGQSQSADAPRSATSSRHNSAAAIRHRRLQSMDIPQRPRRRSSEMAIRPASRDAGIGGFINAYRRSGIGNNVPEDRDSGIGKLCFEENEGPGGGSRKEQGSFSSSLHKLSSVKKAMSFSNLRKRPQQDPPLLSSSADVNTRSDATTNLGMDARREASNITITTECESSYIACDNPGCSGGCEDPSCPLTRKHGHHHHHHHYLDRLRKIL